MICLYRLTVMYMRNDKLLSQSHLLLSSNPPATVIRSHCHCHPPQPATVILSEAKDLLGGCVLYHMKKRPVPKQILRFAQDDSRRVRMVNKAMSKKNLYHAGGEPISFYTGCFWDLKNYVSINRGLKMLITKWKCLLNLL